jgi:hypothetical protein
VVGNGSSERSGGSDGLLKKRVSSGLRNVSSNVKASLVWVMKNKL